MNDPQLSIQPDWILVGAQSAAGVRLFASTTLGRAELTYRMRAYEERYLGPPTYTLAATFKDMVVVDAPDYPTAFEYLFRDWTPTGTPPMAVGAAVREIGS